MKKRRIFTREFKISVVREVENGKTAAEVCRENSIHPMMLYRWKREYKENPKEAFSGYGNVNKLDAKIAEYERVIGQLYAENKFLKKTLSTLEIKLTEYQKIN
jgi:transposase